MESLRRLKAVFEYLKFNGGSILFIRVLSLSDSDNTRLLYLKNSTPHIALWNFAALHHSFSPKSRTIIDYFLNDTRGTSNMVFKYSEGKKIRILKARDNQMANELMASF